MNTRIYKQILQKSPWDDSEEEENIFTRSRKRSPINFDNFQFEFNKKTMFLVFIGLFILWLASGIYEIKEGEEAAVIRFGRYDRTGMPGLNYRLPSPIENTIIEKVNQSRRIEIGYRSTNGRNSITNASIVNKDVNSESIMLTGDENIVELNVDVMWHISDLADYVFNVVNPQETVKLVAESAIREVIGNTPIASVLSNQKQEITERIESLIQQTLAQYKIGVIIEQVQLLKAEPPVEVIQAYRDVQTSKADKEKEINQAQAYNNDILPKARGEAAKIVEEAVGYKESIIARAKGDTSRFNSIFSQYYQNKDITRSRLYIETLEEVLREGNKVIMGGDGVLPHMAIKNNPSLIKD